MLVVHLGFLTHGDAATSCDGFDGCGAIGLRVWHTYSEDDGDSALGFLSSGSVLFVEALRYDACSIAVVFFGILRFDGCSLLCTRHVYVFWRWVRLSDLLTDGDRRLGGGGDGICPLLGCMRMAPRQWSHYSRVDSHFGLRRGLHGR